MMKPSNRYLRYIFAVVAGAVYGVAVRVAFKADHYLTKHDRLFPNDLWVMTAGFLLVVPFVAGWITISQAQPAERYRWGSWIFTPWLPILVGDIVLLLTFIEGSICLIFAVPITLVMSSLGGIAAGLTYRTRLRRRSTLICLAIAPLLISGSEMQLTAPLDVRTVQTSIIIHAPASVVWQNIERVPAIQPGELKPTWTHRIGFPLPVEATLDHEGVGGIRHASFQGGLLFIETITEWKPQQLIRFEIKADTAHIPAATLDEHVTIGGRFFDVLNGEYRLEPLPDGNVLLHLSSQERLSTDFNAYAALWTDAVMRNLQQSILQVVKARCESQ